MKLKSLLSIVLVVALLAIAVTSVIKNNAEKEEVAKEEELLQGVGKNEVGGLELGEKAPNFTLQTMGGEEVSLSDFKGKKVMINFWATWCPPCRAETPHLVNYYNENAEKENFEILSVNAMSTESSSDKVSEFIEQYKMKFPVVVDPRGELVKKYEVLNFPTSFFINTEGVIQEKRYVIDEKQLAEIVKGLD